MKPHVFREYDIRGVVGRDLDATFAEQLGQAFGTLVLREGSASETPARILVGRDCRLSSPELTDALCRGLAATGAHVTTLGMVPTPVLYFASHQHGADAAVQLTGSHNPPDFNGFKMVLGGAAVYGEQIQQLRTLIEAQDFATGGGRVVEYERAVADYVAWVRDHAEMGPRRLKVVVDAGNGAGGPTAVATLAAIGIDVVPLYCEPDGRFPNHHPDPTVLVGLEDLRSRVRAEDADFGIGLDGDGDRIGVVDAGGDVLWGDKLMIVLARSVLEAVPGATIVAEVKCSQTLFDDIAAHGGVPVMWKVGHSLIKAKMKAAGAALAGEMSGHIFFGHRFFGFDDAIYTATRLAEIVSASARPLRDYLDGVPETFATPEIRIDTGTDAVKFEAAEAVAEHYRSGGGEGVRDLITLDGVRVVFADGWGLVRASNTQPVLVMRAEATTAGRRDAIERELRERIEQALAATRGDE